MQGCTSVDMQRAPSTLCCPRAGRRVGRARWACGHPSLSGRPGAGVRSGPPRAAPGVRVTVRAQTKPLERVVQDAKLALGRPLVRVLDGGQGDPVGDGSQEVDGALDSLLRHNVLEVLTKELTHSG